jgi:hypothetical protein
MYRHGLTRLHNFGAPAKIASVAFVARSPLLLQLQGGQSRREWKRCITGPPTPSFSPQPVDDAVDKATGDDFKPNWKGTAFKMFEAAMTTLASIGVLG